MNQPELTRLARQSRSRQVDHAHRYVRNRATARVTVAWTPSNRDGASPFAPIELELVAAGPDSKNRTWRCPAAFGSNWLETVASARCSEVLLTARLDNDVPAKHLVLELAERLALTLTNSQPLVRVLFLPTTHAPRVAPQHA